MALRTNSLDVRALLQKPEADVYAFITFANDVVNDMLQNAGLSSTILGRIESLLACHFYTQATPDVVRETYAGATFEYPRNVSTNDKGFASTKWGQMAIVLDTSGTLRGINKTPAIMHII